MPASMVMTSQTSHPRTLLVSALLISIQIEILTFDVDRMPTVSAAQALQELDSPATTLISTSLTNLDLVLQNKYGQKDAEGGISRGHVTEVYGPPGVGKTAFG